MVGLGTLLFLLSALVRRDLGAATADAHRPVFLSIASAAGVLAVITMEAGWVVTEVGRQPWIVYHQMKVEDAATANTGVWITFIAVTLLYLALGVTAILVLRGMATRFRRAGGFAETEGPTALG